MESDSSAGDRRSFLKVAVFAIGGALSVGQWTRAHDATPEASPAAVASPIGTPAAIFDASMRSLKFVPQQIEISVGTTVVWKNEDTVSHTVTHRAKPEDQLFASPMIAPGETFSFTFDETGTWSYFCLPHPFMTGTVVVS